MMVKITTFDPRKSETVDIQRWEDDGGPMNDRYLVQPVPINAGTLGRSMTWHKGLVIEPFLPDQAILWIRKKRVMKNA